MKKFFCSILIIFIFFAGNAFGEEVDNWDFYISNVQSISGGNKGAFVDKDTHPVHEDIIKNIPSRERIEYIYNVQKVYGFAGNEALISVENGKYASKPIAENSIPKEKNALRNAKNPVNVVVSKNEISIFSFVGKYCNIEALKIFDAKGKFLAECNRKKNPDCKLKVSSSAKNFYVEVLTTENKYCYVLLRISADTKIKLSDEEIKFVKSVLNEYMQKNNIASYNDITRKQDEEIVTLFNRIKDLQIVENNAAEVFQISQYMKENKISYCDLLDDKKYEAVVQYIENLGLSQAEKIDKLVEKRGKTYENLDRNDAMEIVVEYLKSQGAFTDMELLHDYMRRHGIKSYEDLTPQDEKNFEAELKNMREKSSRH